MKTLLTIICLSVLCLCPAESKSQTLEKTATATQEVTAEGDESSVAGTTPINWLPFVRALLVTGTLMH